VSVAARAHADAPAFEAVQPRARVRAVPVRAALVAFFLVSTAGHAALAWLRPMPSLFPDEYIYAALGRSLAHTGRPLVRGGSAHFPALLQPLLTAPVWLIDDVNAAYRVLQLENALVISLAVFPVYAIARRLGIGRWMSLALAGLSLAGPQLLFASGVLSEPFSYPLLLGAVAVALALLERPSHRLGIAFVTLALLCAVARVQLAVVPVCVLAAVIAVGLHERRLRRALRMQPYVVGFVAVELFGSLLLAATHHLGYYKQLVPTGVTVGGAGRITGMNVFVVLLSAGCALAPGAVVGWALALAKPRTRTELAFGALTTVFALALLGECALYGDVHLVQERYLFYLVPLVAVCFALRATRTERRRLAEAGTAAALVAAASALPLAGYATSSKGSIAPFLFAVDRLEWIVHDPGTASLIVAGVATVVAGIAVSARAGVVLALSAAFSLAALAGGFSFDRLADLHVRKLFLPADRSWIDHARVGNVTYLAATGATRNPALATMFWNPSIDRLLLLPATARFDKLPQAQAEVAADGTLLVHGTPVRRSVVTDEQLATVRLKHASRVAHFNVQTLYRPHGRVRLASVLVGRVRDGRLVAPGALLLWPGVTRAAGWLELDVSAAKNLDRGGLRLRRKNGERRTLLVRGGETRRFRIPVCGPGSWQATVTPLPRHTGGVRVGVPRYVPDAGACR
jgi:hypothetical protein